MLHLASFSKVLNVTDRTFQSRRLDCETFSIARKFDGVALVSLVTGKGVFGDKNGVGLATFLAICCCQHMCRGHRGSCLVWSSAGDSGWNGKGLFE